MARAIGINRPGGPEVLEVIDRPVTLDAENELAVRLAGAPGSKLLLVLKPKT